MAGIRYAEWLNRNSARAFPFREDSDMRCSGSGPARLPDDFLLDMRLVASGVDRPESGARLAKVVVADGVCTASFTFGDRSFELSVREPGFASCSSNGLYARAFIGRIPESAVMTNPPEILPSRILVFPDKCGVDVLSVGGVSAAGVIRVEDGVNTELRVRGKSVILKIGSGLGDEEPCPEYVASGAKLVHYLNGQRADSNGNLTLFGGDGTIVSTGKYKGIPAVIVKADAVMEGFTGA